MEKEISKQEIKLYYLPKWKDVLMQIDSDIIDLENTEEYSTSIMDKLTDSKSLVAEFISDLEIILTSE